MKAIALFILALSLVGCAATKPLKGGKATTSSVPARGVEQSVVQSDNPAQESRRIRRRCARGATRCQPAPVWRKHA